MLFTIYCLGDVKLFASALNGVAMMFKVASGGTMDIWASNSGWGLGYGALLGALMALLIMIYTGYQKKQLDFRNVLLPLILYFGLTVPKATVVIQDQYSNQAPVNVDNVPIGLALPLGAISNIAYSATKQLETIYYIPYRGFTRITDEGYVASLKLMHALKYTGISSASGIPNLKPTLKEISKICLVNNEQFNIKKYKNEVNGFDAFINALNAAEVSNRYVRVPVSGAIKERVLSCSEAGDYVSSALDAYMAGKNSNATLQMLTDLELEKRNFQTDVKNALDQQENASENQGVKYRTNSEIVTAVGNLAGATNQEVVQFLKTGLLDSTLSAVNYCTASNLESDKAKCQNYITSLEQWKEKTAAEASGFVSIMRDGQNLLIVLAIVLFPLVLIVVIIQGVSSFKIFGSYILFTICAFMWLPVASIINYYTHLQLFEELQRLNATSNIKAILSLKNSPAFYDAVSVKLSLANGALSSVPMICMGLFSGMLLTINGLIDKWNTQAKYYDSKSNIPNTIKRNPIVSVGSSVNYASIGGKATLSGLAQAQNTSKGNEISQTLKQVEGAKEKNSKNLGRILEDKNVQNMSFEQKWAVVQKAVESVAHSNTDENTKKLATAVMFSKVFGGGEGENKNYMTSIDKDGSTVYQFKNGTTVKAGLRLGVQLGNDDGDANNPDKNSNGMKNKASGALNKLLKRTLISPEIGMGNTSGGSAIFQDKTDDIKNRNQGYGIQSNESVTASKKDGTANNFSRAEQLTSEFQDVLAAKIGQSVSKTLMNEKSNTASASWSQKVEDYKRSSNEVKQTFSYAVDQSKDAVELANQIKVTPQLAASIKANIDASKMQGNAEYEHHVSGLIRVMNESSLKLLSDNDKLLLAQHSALKMMGGETAVNAVKAEYGEFEFKNLDDNFVKDHKIKEKVENVFNKVNINDKIEAVENTNFNLNIDADKQKVSQMHAKYDALSEQQVKHSTAADRSVALAKADHKERENELQKDKAELYKDAPIAYDFGNLNHSELWNLAAAKNEENAWEKTHQSFEKADKHFEKGEWFRGSVAKVVGAGNFGIGAVHHTIEIFTPTPDDAKGFDRSTGKEITAGAQEAYIKMHKDGEEPSKQIDKSNEYIERKAKALTQGGEHLK